MGKAFPAWRRLIRTGAIVAAAVTALGRDRRGGTAIIFAVSVPILALLTCGTVDLASLSSDHAAMQDAADAAALNAAKQLGIGTNAGIASRATLFANTELTAVAQRVPFTTSTVIAPDNSSVTVTINGHRSSFFANMLPPGGWSIHVQATASNLGQTPLCVLASSTTGPAITLTNEARTTATGCLVHSDSDITVNGAATLTAGTVQAVGTANGAISPAPQAGAPSIADPFASMPINPPPLNICNPIPVLTAGLNILAATPTPYCGNITVGAGQTLQLQSGGAYYFRNGQLHMQQNSVLQGTNVTLIFDNTSQFQFQDSAVIDLTGARSGPYAGFVIVTTRQNVGTFTISSDSARRLEGAVYVPNAKLIVTGSGNRVADQSAWTVIVAKSLQLTGSPDLVINANYATSSVPVPNGVGPTGSNKVKLAR